MSVDIKKEFIQDFGEAYQRFGHQKLMGRIVGLLLYYRKPLSLNQIIEELNVSKGPTSQLLQRLRDTNVVQRIWVPGDRKDYYQCDGDAFVNAFANLTHNIKLNLDLAQKYKRKLEQNKKEENNSFGNTITEMDQFYSLMLQYFQEFSNKWQSQLANFSTDKKQE